MLTPHAAQETKELRLASEPASPRPHPAGAHAALLALLAEAGYAVAFRADAWVECLASRGEERWVGRGADEADALGDAARRMFPAHVARLLLHARLALPAAAPPPAVVVAAGAAPPLPSEPAAAVNGLAAPPEPAPSISAIQDEPTVDVTSTPAPPSEPASAAPAEPAPRAVAAAPPPPAPSPSRPLEKPAANERARVDVALAALDSLIDEIDSSVGLLARMPPERQRLWLHLWICWARAYEEQLPDHRDVVRSVSRVARRLTELCKVYWPGNVRALQLLARPAEVAIRPQASRGAAPETWSDTAGLAEKALDEHLERAKKDGLDEDGWADAASLVPAPSRAEDVLAEVAAELEALTGPLGAGPGVAPELAEGVLARLVECGRSLRWTRRAAPDPERWGVLLGRLRWVAHALGDSASPLREVLEPSYRPQAPWARLAERGLKDQQQQEAEQALLQSLPTLEMGRAALVSWLFRAFDVLDTPRLADVVAPLKAEVIALEEVGVPQSGRRARRRLRELVKRLNGEDVGAAPAPPSRSLDLADTPAPETMPSSAISIEVLAEKIRPHTKGRHALFVSNRDDAELEARLVDLLGLRISWCDGSQRRIDAQCERIANQTYHFVLSATGFQNHSVDASLAKATHAAKIPLIRVNRGRPLACVQALAREFGLSPRA